MMMNWRKLYFISSKHIDSMHVVRLSISSSNGFARCIVLSRKKTSHNDRNRNICTPLATSSKQSKQNDSPKTTMFPAREWAIKQIKSIGYPATRTPPPYIVAPPSNTRHWSGPGSGTYDQRFTPSQVLWLKNQLVLLFPPSLAPSWLCTLPTSVGTPGPSPGVLALGPPPPRRGLAMRPKGLFAKLGWEGAAPPRPRVEPCLAASRRSLTARSWDSNL